MPDDRADQHKETFEGRPIDPRFDRNVDPLHDPRYDTNLNPAMVPPKNLSAGLRILALVLGVFLLGLLIFLMYWRFQEPAPRSPEQSRLAPVLLIVSGESVT